MFPSALCVGPSPGTCGYVGECSPRSLNNCVRRTHRRRIGRQAKTGAPRPAGRPTTRSISANQRLRRTSDSGEPATPANQRLRRTAGSRKNRASSHRPNDESRSLLGATPSVAGPPPLRFNWRRREARWMNSMRSQSFDRVCFIHDNPSKIIREGIIEGTIVRYR